MMQLECHVFWFNDEQQEKHDLGIDESEFDIEESDLMVHTFYHIDFIRPHNKKYTSVASGGDIFIVNESYETLKKRLQVQYAFPFSQ